MNKKLGDEDGRAVDLLLNREQTLDQSDPFALPSPVVPQRVQSVEKVLSLLQAYPAGEPPADLAGRTLRKVDKALSMLTNSPAEVVDAATRPQA